jgi:hypothetical protein
MLKCVGKTNLSGFRLKYYVFGSHKEGYGVRIVKINAESACQYISRNLTLVLDFARKLHRCSVFPTNLHEIADDLDCSGSSSMDKTVASFSIPWDFQEK